jgi:methionyl-tRNA formyltransferase
MRGMGQPIVFLGREDSPVLAYLRAVEEDVVARGPEQPFDPEEHRPRLVVSHGYRRILREHQIADGRVINLHISLLPYNRGADPTLWSVLEGTPAGVTLHYIDPGVDTGDVIAQREVSFDDEDTLKTAYDKLQAALLELFKQTWPAIADGTNERRAQRGEGTSHRVKDRAAVEHLLTDGWDTKVGALRGQCIARS